MRVARVDKVKGYLDLSKKDVNPRETKATLDRFHGSKMVHSILIHVAEDTSCSNLTDLA